MKVMSIIGIVWFSISFLFILASIETDMEVAAGWGILGLLYALPYSIVGLVKSNKKQNMDLNKVQVLTNLSELKAKGILSEMEFESKKNEILKQM